jgi:hypothetical protein
LRLALQLCFWVALTQIVSCKWLLILCALILGNKMGGNKKPPCGGFSLFFDSAPVQTAAECGSAVLGLCD